MPQRCRICHHPKRREIDRALSDSSESMSSIAARFGVSRYILGRHRDLGHIIPVTTDPALDEAGLVKDRALECLRIAEESGDIRSMCAALKEARECIGLLSRMNAGAKGETSASIAGRKVSAMSDEEVIARARRALARKG